MLVGEVKCNVDTTIFKEQGCYGIGMCLRGDRGEFIRAKATWYKGIPQSKEVKARGLKEMIKWTWYFEVFFNVYRTWLRYISVFTKSN